LQDIATGGKGAGRAREQHLVQVAGIGEQVTSPAPKVTQRFVDCFDRQVLERRRTAVADLFGDVAGVAVDKRTDDRQQVRHLRTTVRVKGDVPQAIRAGATDRRGSLVLAGAEQDGVPASLGHLGPVHPQHRRGGRQQGVGLDEDRSVAGVEPPGDRPGHLDVRELVAADRDDITPQAEDVGRLVHGIGEQQPAQRPAGGQRFGLHRGIAVQFGIGHQREERQHQLIERRDGRMRDDHRPPRVDPGREIFGDQGADPVPQRPGLLPVGDHLVVRNDHCHRNAQILQPDPVRQGADVVAKVQWTGRPVAGDDPVRAGVAPDVRRE